MGALSRICDLRSGFGDCRIAGLEAMRGGVWGPSVGSSPFSNSLICGGLYLLAGTSSHCSEGFAGGGLELSVGVSLCSKSLMRDVVAGIGVSSSLSLDAVVLSDPVLLFSTGAGDFVFRMEWSGAALLTAGEARAAARAAAMLDGLRGGCEPVEAGTVRWSCPPKEDCRPWETYCLGAEAVELMDVDDARLPLAGDSDGLGGFGGGLGE